VKVKHKKDAVWVWKEKKGERAGRGRWFDRVVGGKKNRLKFRRAKRRTEWGVGPYRETKAKKSGGGKKCAKERWEGEGKKKRREREDS